MATDWSLDYCLGCDSQTAGEAYCSQACRLADLETSSCASEPASPTSTHGIAWPPASRSPVTTGFFIPPAFDFSAYRSKSSSVSATTRPGSTGSFSTLASSAASQPTSSSRVLTPSSSRSSLASVHSLSTQGEFISSQARSELRDYTNSFDQVRDRRRRMTTS